MYILGLPSIHNPTWTLVKDGEPLVSIEEDRLHRIKNRFGLTDHNDQVNVLSGFDYVLTAAGLSCRDVDAAAFGFNPSSTYYPDAFDIRLEHSAQERIFSQQILLLRSLRKLGLDSPVYYVRHHLAHAAAVFFSVPTENAAILTADGWGEDETMSISCGKGTQIESIATVQMPHSLGELYNVLTTRIGWGMDDAGKTMALAAYGDATISDDPLIRYHSDGNSLFIDTSDALSFVTSLPQRRPGSPVDQTYADASATIQRGIETALVLASQWAVQKTGAQDLCISGGVALNCVANHRILAESGCHRLLAQPACGDSGIPLGAAQAVFFHLHPNRPRSPIFRPYLGREYSESEIRGALSGTSYIEFPTREALAEQAGALLQSGAVIGWFQGRSEFGPRALGNRCILANPTVPGIRDRVNLAIKRRESFRPFAPSVLLEHADTYFQGLAESPFMLIAFPVKPEYRSVISAVMHRDGTARVQTVSKSANPLFHAVIEAFRRASGLPLVLNTSFNLAGEPIVETPIDAVSCFHRSELDMLALDRFLVKR